MDSMILSAVCTGAVGGLKAKYLARRGLKVHCLIGMGVQARTLAAAIKEALPSLREIRGLSQGIGGVQGVKEIESLASVNTEFIGMPEKAVDGADVIVTATVADEPIVKEK